MPKVKQVLRKVAESRVSLNVAALLLTDFQAGVKHALGHLETNSGTRHAHLNTDSSIEVIEELYGLYRSYAGVDDFCGTVAEVGPGDNAGVALLLLKSGCSRVDLVDRFVSAADSSQQEAIYTALSSKHSLESYRIGLRWNSESIAGVQWHHGKPAERYFADCEGPTYDYIFSRSVLEHLYDPIGALRLMARCLRPGGCMVHIVDLRDHLYLPAGRDRMSWLRVPRWLWALSTRFSGRPNRILFHEYARAARLLSSDGVTCRLLIRGLVSAGRFDPAREPSDISQDDWNHAASFVNERRRDFSRDLRKVGSEDLAVEEFVIVGHKPLDSAGFRVE